MFLNALVQFRLCSFEGKSQEDDPNYEPPSKKVPVTVTAEVHRSGVEAKKSKEKFVIRFINYKTK